MRPWEASKANLKPKRIDLRPEVTDLDWKRADLRLVKTDLK